MLRSLSLTFLFALLMGLEAHTEVLRVSNLNASGANSLRARIETDAAPGDTVWIDVAGTISISSPIRVKTNVTLLGPKPTHLTIDANGNARHFIVDHPNAVSKMRGIRLVNGYASSGSGGSILVRNGSLRIWNFAVEYSSAEGDGGAIANLDTLKVNSSSFLKCNSSASGDGGALYSKGGFWVMNCTFSMNDASGKGGAIFNDTSGLGRIRHSTIIHNYAGDDGGGIGTVDPNEIHVTTSILEYNGAGLSGPNLYTPATDTIDSYGYNLIADTSGANFNEGSGELLQGAGTSGLSDSTAIDTNGFGARYYPLPSSSNAIDNGPTGPSNNDQRSAPRPIDGDKDGVNHRDMGAVEYTPYQVDATQSLLGMTLGDAISDIDSRNSPPYYISFELAKDSLIDHSSIASPYELSQRVVIDGFSHPESEVPGPNDPTQSTAQVSKGSPMVQVDGNVLGISDGFIFRNGAERSVLRGLSIVGHGANGIRIEADSVRIFGNHIGLGPRGDGSDGKANSSAGVLVTNGASRCWIGAHRHAARNVFGLLETRHLYIDMDAGTRHRIYGNFIGLKAGGAGPISSGGGIVGVRFENVRNFVGWEFLAGRNVISGNQDGGIVLRGMNYRTEDHRFSSNHIGTDYEGMNSIPNGADGIYASFSGGVSYVDNLISGNAGSGIYLGGDSDSSLVRDNTIGLASDDSTGLGNQGSGIVASPNSLQHRIGDDRSDGPSNLIAFNGRQGIRLEGSEHEVQGNSIGTIASGMQSAPNAGNGILLGDCMQCLIGGDRDSSANLISGNDSSGIRSVNTYTADVQGNYIGTDQKQGAAIPNRMHGIHIDHATGRMTIGGLDSSLGNVVAGNQRDGIRIENGTAYQKGHRVGNNFIGIDDSTTKTSLGNGAVGVRVNGDSNTIGHPPSFGNHIAYNQGAGIQMDSDRTNNAFLKNRIHDNAGLGIDLGGDGVTVNDSGDTDIGPNSLRNHPDLLGYSICGGQSYIKFAYQGLPTEDYRIEFYRVPTGRADPSGHGEGNEFLLADTVTMGSITPDTFQLSYSPAFSMGPDDSLTATATLVSGGRSTSEFAANIPAADSLTLSLDSIDPITCAGDSDAIGYVSYQGGIPPVNVTWYDSTYSYTAATGTTASGLGPGNYRVTLMDDAGCEDTLSVTVNPADTVDANAGPNDTVCLGDSLILGGSPTSSLSGVVYDWSPGSDLVDSTVANPTAYPSSSTDHVVTVTDSSTGCTAMDTVSIDTLPALTASARPDTTICQGDSVFLGGYPTSSGGSGTHTYQWTPNDSLSSDTSADPQAYPADTTLYHLQVQDAMHACSAEDSVEVATASPPSLQLNSPDSICNGDTAILSVNAPGDSLFWNTGATNDSIRVSPNSNTFYWVQKVDTVSGCTADTGTIVQVDSVPSVILSGPDTICEGDSLGLDAIGASNYSWQDGSTGKSYDVVADSSRHYWVEGSNAAGCSDRDSLYVNVLSAPSVPSSSSTQQTLCPGDSFVAFGVAPDSNRLTRWYKDSTLSAPVASGDTLSGITLSGDSTYRYAAYEDTSSGCSGPALEFLVLRTDPSSLRMPSDARICPGDSARLMASGASSYSWSPSDGLSDTNVAAPSAAPSSSIGYRLEARFANGCQVSDSVRVVVGSGGDCGLEVYNAFSPNGDGINEEWIIDGIRAYPDNRVTIFNRWGDRLDRIEGYDNDEKVWDGTRSDGEALPAGTYYYVIEIHGDRTRQLKGYVQITR